MIIGMLVVQTISARFWPLPLKWRYFALSGIANMLRGPHSKLRLAPSGNSSCVLPVPSRM